MAYSRSASRGDLNTRGVFSFPAPPDFPPPGKFGVEPSLGDSKSPKYGLPKLSSGEPAWASSGAVQFNFGKKADVPAAESDGYSPTTPEDGGDVKKGGKIEAEPTSSETPPDKFSIPEGVGGFRKKAERGPPAALENPEPRPVPPIQTKRPVRQSVLDGEKLGVFRSLAMSLFEDLVILQVEMELLPDVMGESNQIDEGKFELFTQPRSPGTGLRYARLLKLYLKHMSNKYTNENRPEVFGSTALQSYIFQLIGEEVGFMTPLSLIYAVEHFATIFGFEAPGTKNPRVRRFATDYSKKAPEKKQAPPFSVAFLDYLEKAVLDHTKPLEFRLVMGKLRLCTQASIRHSDLATTALNRVEWCRIVGEEKVLGLRAKADRTKSGPRPWSASMLGVNPRNDEWMVTFVEILFRVHGPKWKTHSFLGCAGDGRGGFICVPPTIGEDVIVMKQAMKHDLENGVQVPLSEAEISCFRWHSCKNTMPSLMVHCGIRTRAIRHQGAWRKASESMVDLYLRETQVLVIKAQLEILDQVRKGVTLNVLEGKSLDQLPGKPGWGPTSGLFEHWPPPGTTADQAGEAMDAASVCEQPTEGEDLTILETKLRHPRDLPDGFKDEVMRSDPHLVKVAQQEKSIMEFEKKRMADSEGDSSAESSAESVDSDETDIEPGRADMALLPFFVIAAAGNGKVHKPAEVLGGFEEPCRPSCGVRGKDFAVLSLDENWGSYSLCERCFGKPVSCAHLCSWTEVRKGVRLRCSRRCETEEGDLDHNQTQEPEKAKHLCSIHYEDT